MTKQKIKNLISALCFLLIFVMLFTGVNYILRDKNEADLIYPYRYERENSLDAVFIGSSHFMCSIYPWELWNGYGIASYNYTASALVLPQAYHQLIEALKTQTPSLVVIDASGAIHGTRVGTKEYVHVQFDNMPLSLNKIEEITTLTDRENWLEYFVPLVKFHSRWKELKASDFQPITGVTKGAYISESVLEIENEPVIQPKGNTAEIPERAEKYLRKILELCKDKNIEVLLLNVPVIASAEEQEIYNAVYSVAQEYGVNYLNLLHELESLNFDFKTDMRDESHCNLSGALKVNDFVGEYIKENYTLPDRRTDPDYTAWYDGYEEYKKEYGY